jgi:hypothetical protein
MFRVLLRQRVKGRPRRREARAVLCPPISCEYLRSGPLRVFGHWLM